MGLTDKRRYWPHALVVYTVILLGATHWPAEHLPKLSLEWGDKLEHIAAYCLWALLAQVVRGPHWGWIIGGVFLAGMDELTQPYFNRKGDWYDWYADLAGIGLGTFLAWWLRRRWGHRLKGD